MDKTALKNFAVESREKLMKDVEDKARLIGITEEGIESPLPESTMDMKAFDIGEIETYKIYGEDVKKYERLVSELEKRQEESDYKTAYNTLIEEVAYTWFNRIIAIRFMEINNYMPDRMRILSSGREGVREPEFVTNYRDTDIGIREEEFERLDELKLDASANSMEELFQFLFIKQSNALNQNLPELFGKTDDYAELLLNISYNDQEGIIYKLIEDIGEEPFDINNTGQIEIIGWLYQYYNTVAKAEVDASRKKVDKNTLPPKTQLFTPEWIVKYMVQNSLGRLWIERKIAIGTDKREEELAKEYGWEYYLPEAEQVEEVKIELKDIREDRKDLKIEDITFIDPSMGSGHILVYAFEMFMQFYLEEGYMEREAAESIIENNIYGLDIDKRAYQLAYFGLMMKGRQYSRRILNKEIENNLYYFIDSKDINLKQIGFLGGNIEDKKSREDMKQDILEITELFRDGRELGSVIKIEKEYDYKNLRNFIKKINENELPIELVGIEKTQRDLEYILNLVEILSCKYDILTTNPPYLASSDMGDIIKKYIDENYKYAKGRTDLFAVFFEMGIDLIKESQFLSMVTMQSWMFLSSFEKLREFILNNFTITNLMHMDNMVMRIAFGTAVTILKKYKVESYIGTYNHIKLKDIEKNDKPKEFPVKENRFNQISEDKFRSIPTMPIAYWISNNVLDTFMNRKLESELITREGMATAGNDRFLRYWQEVSFNNIGFNVSNLTMANDSKLRWFPYHKGGSFRKWYGNNFYIVDWENDGERIKNNIDKKTGRIRSHNYNGEFSFKRGITWSSLSSGDISFRHSDIGFLFDSKGAKGFIKHEKYMYYIFALLNSKVAMEYLSFISPTMDFKVGDIILIPFIAQDDLETINNLVKENIRLSKADWDSFETSWDFKIHRLLNIDKRGEVPKTIESAYENWKECTNNNFTKLKENEEKLNELFIEIYGLEDELKPEVSDKDITVAKIFDDKKDIYDDIKGNAYILTKEDVVKSFISYGVGCILGRYSLDEKGLVYAGGEFDINRCNKFKPVEDNIILITDEEYFEDDLVNRFVDFVKVSFGEKNLEENLKFIADSLKGRGSSREKIRDYFVNDFYEHHCNQYSMPRDGKRPIYWTYDSSAGKTKRQSQNGFKALVYMHRYDADTTGKVRIDYLHKVQRMYERRMDFLKDDIAHNKDAKKVSESEKELEKIIKQVKECKDYDEKIGHIALSRIDIDLDDGVKVNYDKVQTDEKGKKYKILAKI